MRPLPIRLRLTLWYGAIFAAAAVLLSLSSWWMLRHILKVTEYNELQERAEDVQLLFQRLGPGASLESLRAVVDENYKIKDDGKYLQIADENGQWIYRSPRLAEWNVQLRLARELPSHGVLEEVYHGTRDVRTLAYPITVNGRSYSVQTGLSLSKSKVLLATFGAQLLLLTPAVLILAAIGGHIMSRKALAPVAAIATMARRINDRSLDVRLPIPATNDEVSHLSETLNQMLERIESGVRSMREFTANAAHELRTPISLIRTEVEVALSFPREADEYRESCEQVQLEATRMTSLIQSLLMLARIDAGTEETRFAPLDAAQLVLLIGSKWKNSMDHALLDFSVIAPNEPVWILADLHSMQRLLTILIDNAMRYTPSGGSVELRAVQQDGVAILSVRDTGIGIAPEHLPRIFDRFYRVDRTRDGTSGGSGLGLALAKWIAEKHNTTLIVESEAGRGTCFRFEIPVVNVQAQIGVRSLSIAGFSSTTNAQIIHGDS
jgi:heavy metal sensor kinase